MIGKSWDLIGLLFLRILSLETNVCHLYTWHIRKQFIVPLSFRVIHSTTHCSPFEDVYGFNPLTPLDLLPINSNIFVSKATTRHI